MTGSVVCAATTPPRCAAAPAPTMNSRTPREGASATSRITRSGDRCAEATVISQGIVEFPKDIDGTLHDRRVGVGTHQNQN